MSKPLTTTRTIFQLAAVIQLKVTCNASITDLLHLMAEFENRCARYAGPASDLDPYLKMVVDSLKAASKTWEVAGTA